jgi:hypothetical protein
MRRLWRALRVVLVIYLGCLLLLMWFEESLIYFPSRRPAGVWNPPGLAIEDAWFTAEDGVDLHGWYLPHENPQAAVLFAHGNAGNITHRADVLRRLHAELSASVLLFDYRGYGRSEGEPNEAGVLADARAARAWLAERAGLEQNQIILMGRSLGGGVMVDLAARDGARALVLESTFTSLPDVAAIHYPMFPVRLLMRNRLASRDKIAEYRGPLLQSHGDADRTIPLKLGQALFDAARSPQKEWFTVPRGDHNDPQPAEWYAALKDFVGGLPK